MDCERSQGAVAASASRSVRSPYQGIAKGIRSEGRRSPVCELPDLEVFEKMKAKTLVSAVGYAKTSIGGSGTETFYVFTSGCADDTNFAKRVPGGFGCGSRCDELGSLRVFGG